MNKYKSEIEVIGDPPHGSDICMLFRAAWLLADHFGGFTFHKMAVRITRDGQQFIYAVTGDGYRVTFEQVQT